MKPKFIISKLNNEIKWTALNEETVEFVISNVIPSGSKYLYMYNDSDIDHSFTFCYDFNFEDDNGTIGIPTFDIEKGKDILLGLIRRKRNKMFSDLDIEYMRALEGGNQTTIQEIVAKKQALRDVTDIDFSNVTTPTDLKEKWPTNILGNSPYENI
jgi:hypothetical protein